MNHKIGLKLFSTNTEALPVAKKLFSSGAFDYLELMALPGTQKWLKYWLTLGVPCVIHAPHSSHGFNLADPAKRQFNKRQFLETREYADSLRSERIIIHPGIMGETKETIRQILGLHEKRLFIENKPFMTLHETQCVGSSPAEIGQIIKETGVGFCLDVVHAVKAGYSRGIDYLSYIKQFLKLKPKIVHLCDSTVKGGFDQHLGLGAGELDMRLILSLCLRSSSGIYFTLEVPERSYRTLSDFRINRELLTDLLEARK